MFSTDQTALREFYKKSWDKLKNKESLSALENQVAAIILEHPEYHNFFDELDFSLPLKYIDMEKPNLHQIEIIEFLPLDQWDHGKGKKISLKPLEHYSKVENLIIDMKEIVIAEVKQERMSRSSDFMRIAKEMSILPMRLSKYCISTMTLHPNIKQNRFKKKQLFINKLKHA